LCCIKCARFDHRNLSSLLFWPAELGEQGSMLSSLFWRFPPIFCEQKLTIFLKNDVAMIFSASLAVIWVKIITFLSNFWQKYLKIYNIGPWKAILLVPKQGYIHSLISMNVPLWLHKM
jgi:hypothetical protein